MDKIQVKISKAKRSRDNRTYFIAAGAILYFIFAVMISLDESNPPPDILVPLSLGFGIGLFFVMFSLTLQFETTKKLIEMEGKLDEIKNELEVLNKKKQ